MASKRAKKGAAVEAAPTPDEPVFAMTLVLGLFGGPVPGKVEVQMGMGLDGDADLCQLAVEAEPLIRPHMVALRDVVLSAIGGVGPFPEPTVSVFKGVPEPATAQPAPFVKHDSRGGHA